MIDTMQMHMSSQPDGDRLPDEVRDIVLKAMEKKPDDRIHRWTNSRISSAERTLPQIQRMRNTKHGGRSDQEMMSKFTADGDTPTERAKNEKRKPWWPF